MIENLLNQHFSSSCFQLSQQSRERKISYLESLNDHVANLMFIKADFIEIEEKSGRFDSVVMCTGASMAARSDSIWIASQKPFASALLDSDDLWNQRKK